MMPTRRPGLRKRLGLRLFSELYRDKVSRHGIATVFWECTLRCNLRCRHCGSDCRAASDIPDMPLSDFLRAVDSVTPHVDPHKIMVVMTGGEPLLRNDLETCGRELQRRGYPWGIVTNGMALTEERFRALAEAGMRSLSLSLDGFEEEHNRIRGNSSSFARTAASARGGPLITFVFNSRFLAMAEREQVRLCSFGLSKTFARVLRKLRPALIHIRTLLYSTTYLLKAPC